MIIKYTSLTFDLTDTLVGSFQSLGDQIAGLTAQLGRFESQLVMVLLLLLLLLVTAPLPVGRRFSLVVGRRRHGALLQYSQRLSRLLHHAQNTVEHLVARQPINHQQRHSIAITNHQLPDSVITRRKMPLTVWMLTHSSSACPLSFDTDGPSYDGDE